MKLICILLTAVVIAQSASASNKQLEGHLDKIEVFQRGDIITYNLFFVDKEILESSSVVIKEEGMLFSTMLHPKKFRDHTKWLTDKEREERERWVITIGVHDNQKELITLHLNTSPRSSFDLKDLLKSYPVERIPNQSE